MVTKLVQMKITRCRRCPHFYILRESFRDGAFCKLLQEIAMEKSTTLPAGQERTEYWARARIADSQESRETNAKFNVGIHEHCPLPDAEE